MNYVCIDFETYHPQGVDIKKVGAEIYVPGVEILCLGYAYSSDPDDVVQLWKPGWPLPMDLYGYIDQGKPIVAHNASFERLVWHHVMTQKYQAPAVVDSQWICSASEASIAGLPRDLDRAARALKLGIEKDWAGRRTMLKLSKPRKPTKHDKSTRHREPIDYVKVYEYCKQDVATEIAVHEALPPMTKMERLIYRLDLQINTRGIRVDRELILAAQDMLAKFTGEYEKALRDYTGGEVQRATQRDRLLGWLNAHGLPELDNVRADTIEALQKREDLPLLTRKVIWLRHQLGLSSVAKFDAMLRRAGPDDRIRGSHIYHGAHTGRWTGSGVQFLNLPRGVNEFEAEMIVNAILEGDSALLDLFYDRPIAAISGIIRSAIVASPGNRLVVVDYAGIENRVAAWLAGQSDLLAAFRSSLDPYKIMASRIYGVPYNDVTKSQRQIGKIAELGLQYGMGDVRFRATAESYGIELEEDFAREVVQIYRDTHDAIRSYWYALDGACKQTIDTGRPHAVDNVRFSIKDRWLRMHLPSKRMLYYREPSLEESEKGLQIRYWGLNQFTRQWEQQKTYGGKLFENLVQAVARDIHVNGLFQVEAYGYPVVLHVYDEVVADVPKGHGSAAEMAEQMVSNLPPWADGCPIAASGFEAQRYRKD